MPAPAFTDPVIASQAAFRAVMNALARPGTHHRVPTELAPPLPLGRGMAAIALALVDFETSVWLDRPLAEAKEVGAWLRFHTGGAITIKSGRAAFAFVSDASALPAFESFALGSAEYPDRSTTVVVEVATLDQGQRLRLKGPGLPGVQAFLPGALPRDFSERWRANRALFPRGIDFIFTCDARIAALPRSTRVIEED
jgi:alpha-D-ribose 1-methylphosphonate 5-triphosphate synthase subunit PhnH